MFIMKSNMLTLARRRNTLKDKAKAVKWVGFEPQCVEQT